MSNLGGTKQSEDTDRNDLTAGIVETIVAGTNITVDSTDPANPIVTAAGGATFHGAYVEDSDTVARTTAALVNTYDTEVYDTDAFGDLGTDNDRLTVPANVTKVQVSSHIDATGIAAGTAGYSAITQYNSSDAVIREFGASFTTGNTLRLHTLVTPVVVVSSGDYFKLETDANDASWSQIYVSLSLEYKDGTL